MRIIPGNTKVKIEIFKGIGVWDLLVAAIAAIMLALIVMSTLPFKLAFIVVHFFITALLLVRFDNEPNYMFIIHMLRHFGFGRFFKRSRDDESLKDIAKRGENAVAFDEIFPEEKSEGKSLEEEIFAETKAERKARLKREKEEYKADTKLLKSKTLTKEEEDAIWLKRANQAKAEKERKANSPKARKKQESRTGDMETLSAFTGISDGYIEYGHYYGVAIEIPSVEFRFFSSYRRANAIENGLGSILRSLKSDYSANIVKIERPIEYSKYEAIEIEKLNSLRASYEAGFIKEEELKSRVAICYDRIETIQGFKKDNKVIVPFYYLVLFDSDKQQLKNSVRVALDALRLGEMAGRTLNDKELAVFLRYTNSLDFDENDIENIRHEDYAKWAMPQNIQFTPRYTLVNGMATHNLRVVNYPTVVYDAWLASLMTYPATKVIVKVKPMDSSKAIGAIDKSLSELRAKVNTAKTDSEALEAQKHLETLQLLLSTLQSDNETLLNTNVYITGYDPMLNETNPKLPEIPESTRYRVNNLKKTIKRIWGEAGFRINHNEFNQAMAYIGSQVSGYDSFEHDGRGIPTNTVAASFPWVFPRVMDDKGVQIGTADGVPVFIDFFKRDSERVNSNMVIVGKSGSGKSFATKTILSNLAADDAKIFILDPEDEYRELAKNLNGKFINVANAQYGRLNPFQIITTLEDDDSDGGATGSYATHLQFLEEFFRQILPDCDKDSLEYLNALVDRVYTNKGITPLTDLSTIKPEDYPIFNDLYDEILREFQRTDNEYIRTMLRTLMNYVSKFSEGGRNAIIWNGPSSITTEENFTVFNFQSLLANRNTTVSNAQMLLVLKYIDNEIMKNRDYNDKYGLNRKIVVVIDEAHVFIDTKYPVALDFMFQLAKRIRKYNGMQIVITQNIKDFVGSEEIARKSSAIINACQYSFIFALSPNDMDDLCKLYEKAGGINESEQEQIVQAGRGQAFTIMSPTSRTTFKVTTPQDIRTMFSRSTYRNPYFTGEGGAENWEEFIQDSREKRDAIVGAKAANEEIAAAALLDEKAPSVTFDEVSDNDLQELSSQISSKVTFTESTDEPDDLEALMAQLSSKEAPKASIPAEVQDVATPAAASSTKTEEILAGLVEKLGTASMLDEIKRTVKEELAKEMAAMGPIVSTVAATQQPIAFAPVAPAAAEIPSASDTAIDFTAAVDDEEPEIDLANMPEDEDDSVPIANIFDMVSNEDLDNYEEPKDEFDFDDDEDEDEDDDHFDIMAFLSQQADASEEEEASAGIDEFINNSTETVLDVSLEQLVSYIKRKKAS